MWFIGHITYYSRGKKMPITESEFTEISNVFKSLSHPTRLKIVTLLAVRPHYSYEIEESFDVDRSTVAKHLSVLKNQNIVTYERIGGKTLYELNCTCLPKIIGCIREHVLTDKISAG